ncbi:MAG TPA: hypothetical protein VHY10_14785 [Xanthobacteraceae bacterium]|nr:hypothetical protein [Xanthobacteraceae bacterium]
MRVGVTGLSALALILSAIGIGRAQAPPPGPPPLAPGFVSAYEIVHTLRAAGFDPLAPPLREGTIYVARATDYRGILMRVVLDARTGTIRDANRIVPGPGNYAGHSGPYGEADDPYGGPLYGPDADEPSDAYGPGPYGRDAYGPVAPPSYDGLPNRPPPAAAPLSPPPAHAAAGINGPPLPRPRPAELASRKPGNTAKPPAAIDAKHAVAGDPKPDAKSSVPSPAAPAASAATAVPAKSGKQPTLTINN